MGAGDGTFSTWLMHVTNTQVGAPQLRYYPIVHIGLASANPPCRPNGRPEAGPLLPVTSIHPAQRTDVRIAVQHEMYPGEA